MGYESKLYIVEKGYPNREGGKRYASIIGMLDMCKFYDLAAFMCSAPETDCYIYADDGNTQILEDRYGAPLTEASVKDVINVLAKALKSGNDYRRIKPALMFLKCIQYQIEHGMWREVVVLHFGH